MAGCDEIRVPAVSREHYQLFLQRGAQMGLPSLAAQGDSGKAQQSGVTVQWNYLAEQQVLVVRCTEAPALLPCAMIDTRIREVLASVMKGDTVREQEA